MDSNQWRIHDDLMMRFSKILYAFRFPEVLTNSPADEDQRERLVQMYFHNDPMALATLRSLVHAAIESVDKRRTHNDLQVTWPTMAEGQTDWLINGRAVAGSAEVKNVDLTKMTSHEDDPRFDSDQ